MLSNSGNDMEWVACVNQKQPVIVIYMACYRLGSRDTSLCITIMELCSHWGNLVVDSNKGPVLVPLSCPVANTSYNVVTWHQSTRAIELDYVVG